MDLPDHEAQPDLVERASRPRGTPDSLTEGDIAPLADLAAADGPLHLPDVLDLEPATEDFLADTLAGLRRQPKTLAPKHFYDERGSALFREICATPEYYIPEAELGVLEAHGAEIAALAGPRAAVVALGAAAGVKARALLDALDSPALYVAVDIAREPLVAAATALAADYPGVRVVAAHADFTAPLELPPSLYEEAGAAGRLAFFPGSTIGNFERSEAIRILEIARGLLRPGDLLVVGADLVKDQSILEDAYNDAAGVTAAFNLNLLERIDRELEGTINTAKFFHRAVWNPDERRIEMHLVAKRDLAFTVAGERFTIQAGETIHTESSYKYEPGEIAGMGAEAGFAPRAAWTDPQGWFGVDALEAT